MTRVKARKTPERLARLGPGEIFLYSGGLLSDGRFAPNTYAVFFPEPHPHRALRRGAAHALKRRDIALAALEVLMDGISIPGLPTGEVTHE